MKKIWNQYSYAIILLFLSCTVAITLSIQHHFTSADTYMKVTVSKGDSLWAISKKYSDQHSLSNEGFVSWVKAHNDISNDKIFPGDKIIIPVKLHNELDKNTDRQLASAMD